MKQGKSSREVYRPKMEPIPKAQNPAAVAQLGIAQPDKAGVMAPRTDGVGYKAPMNSSSIHKSGTQGRH